MLLLDVCLSYGGFQPDHMIYCRSLAPEAALGVDKKLDSMEQTSLLLTMRSIVLLTPPLGQDMTQVQFLSGV